MEIEDAWSGVRTHADESPSRTWVCPLGPLGHPGVSNNLYIICGAANKGPIGGNLLKEKIRNKKGAVRESNPRPLAPEARIIPLDQRPVNSFYEHAQILRKKNGKQNDGNKNKHMGAKWNAKRSYCKPSSRIELETFCLRSRCSANWAIKGWLLRVAAVSKWNLRVNAESMTCAWTVHCREPPA